MRPDTQLRVARRKHTIELLRCLYARRATNLNGTTLSLEHRRRLDGGVADSQPLTYGEVDVTDFLSILDIVKPREGEIFVDLGSGTGKAVLTAACGFPEFSECRGIELVEGLADAANDHLQTVRAFLASPDTKSDPTQTKSKTESGTSKHVDTAIFSHTGATSNEAPHTGGRGRSRKKKGADIRKAADQGLSPSELERLIVDMLTRPIPASEIEIRRDSKHLQAVTAEELASRLVKELGHRRYKASLRGYGGLQKFLASLIGSQASGRLAIAAGGSTLSLKQGVATASCDSSPCSCRGEGSCGDATTPQNGDVINSVLDSLTVALQNAEIVDGGLLTQGSVGAQRMLPRSCSISKLGPALCSSSDPEPVVAFGSEVVTLPPAAMTSPNMSTATQCQVQDGVDVDAERGDGGSRGGVGSERRRSPEAGPLTSENLRGVKLVGGDIFELPWNDAGVVYVASLLFDDAMMARLGECVTKLQKGSRVISLRPIDQHQSPNGIDDANFRPRSHVLRLLQDGVFRMSWQMARVYIYVRL